MGGGRYGSPSGGVDVFVASEVENVRFLFYGEIDGVLEDLDKTGQDHFQIVLPLQLSEENGDDVAFCLIRHGEVQDVQAGLGELEIKRLPIICRRLGVEEIGFQTVEVLIVVEHEPHATVQKRRNELDGLVLGHLRAPVDKKHVYVLLTAA